MDRLEELRNNIESSIGFRIQAELELLLTNFYVFDMNYQQWKKYLSPLKETKNLLNLWDQKNRAKFTRTLNEITRLLLNLLASAKSLVSITRNSVPVWYQNTDFAEEYKVKKDALAQDVECRFIEDLRNYSQHYQLPFARGTMQFNSESEIVGKFVLSKVMLQTWKGWAKGKAYLLTSEDDIDLEVLIDSYYNKILDFHKWIFNRIQEINYNELKMVDEKQKELSILLKNIYESD